MRRGNHGLGLAVRKAATAIGLILALTLVAGCESARDPQLLDNPNYSTGYGDGCQTSQRRITGFDETITRNEVLAETEPAYRIGWRDGINACGGQDMDATTEPNQEVFQRGSDHYGSAPQ